MGNFYVFIFLFLFLSLETSLLYVAYGSFSFVAGTGIRPGLTRLCWDTSSDDLFGLRPFGLVSLTLSDIVFFFLLK